MTAGGMSTLGSQNQQHMLSLAASTLSLPVCLSLQVPTRDFQVAIHLIYEDVGSPGYYSNVAFNATIEVVEKPKLVDMEGIFMYLMIFGLLGGAGEMGSGGVAWAGGRGREGRLAGAMGADLQAAGCCQAVVSCGGGPRGDACMLCCLLPAHTDKTLASLSLFLLTTAHHNQATGSLPTPATSWV